MHVLGDTRNKNCVRKFCRKIAKYVDWQQVAHAFRRYGLKQGSADRYSRGLKCFCRYINQHHYTATDTKLNPDNFETFGLETIEDLTADFIADNRSRLSPKYLNVIFNAIKRWCYIQKMIKTTKMFREIKFDKSSRKSEALLEQALETRHIKTLFKIANLEDSVDVGWYALIGLRPSLIPQMKVKDINPRNYEIDAEGAFRFTKKPALAYVPRTYKGNKANITFMVFIPTQLCDRIELFLNRNGRVTKQTKLAHADNSREVYYKMKTLLTDKAVGFEGRPYLLRSYADDILMRIERIKNDRDLKEFLMGHKGKISAIYQMRGLSQEKEDEYRKMYVEACDEWINTNIFDMRSKEEIDKGSIILEMAQSLGVSEEKAMALYRQLEAMKLDFKTYNEKMTELVKQAHDSQMERKFEEMFLKMQQKHNNANDANSA